MRDHLAYFRLALLPLFTVAACGSMESMPVDSVVEVSGASTSGDSPDIVVEAPVPVLTSPTLARNGAVYTVHTDGVEELLLANSPPLVVEDTLTFFTAVLAGSISGPTTMFTEGQDFTFTLTFRDGQPVKLLSGVVDSMNQLSFTISELDPTTGAFRVRERGMGNALFDGNGSAPPTGPIAVVFLRHLGPGVSPKGPNPFSVEAIAHSDDSTVVTPANVTFYNECVVESINRYEEPDSNVGGVFKLRVGSSVLPGTAHPASNPPDLLVDTIQLVPDGHGHVLFMDEAGEQGAVLPTPVVNRVTPSAGSAGTAVEIDGLYFDRAFDDAAARYPGYADDQRQIYFETTNPDTGLVDYVYPEVASLDADGTRIELTLPRSDFRTASYDLVVCTLGRLCTVSPGALQITGSDLGPAAQ